MDWESRELSEDEDGQLEVIHTFPPSARNVTELLSTSSWRRSGLLDLIPEGKVFSVSCLGVLFLLGSN